MNAWRGDTIRKGLNPGDEISADDMAGWHFSREEPIPKDRMVWVITEYLRRCVVSGGTFVRWSIADTRALLWHDAEVDDLMIPPDFPVGMRVTRKGTA